MVLLPFPDLVPWDWHCYIGNLVIKHQTYKNKFIIFPIIYTAIIAGAFYILPPNPDKISVPLDLVQDFRVASAFTMSIFWGLLAITFGAFWNRLKPHEVAKITTV